MWPVRAAEQDAVGHAFPHTAANLLITVRGLCAKGRETRVAPFLPFLPASALANKCTHKSTRTRNENKSKCKEDVRMACVRGLTYVSSRWKKRSIFQEAELHQMKHMSTPTTYILVSPSPARRGSKPSATRGSS